MGEINDREREVACENELILNHCHHSLGPLLAIHCYYSALCHFPPLHSTSHCHFYLFSLYLFFCSNLNPCRNHMYT